MSTCNEISSRSESSAACLSKSKGNTIVPSIFIQSLLDFSLRRDYTFSIEGWAAVMAQLENCSRLASINGISCPGLVTGGLTDLCIASQEEGLALGFFRYLARSGASLTSLDLR